MSSNNSERNFQQSLSQFRWAQGRTDDSQQGNQQKGFFGRMYDSASTMASNAIPVRSNEQSNEEEAYFALSRWDRLLGFIVCLLGAAACFFVSFLTLPTLALIPRKFALSFSLGSLLVMAGFSVLMGPINHLKHLLSKERLPFPIPYFSSLALTLYFSVGLKSYIGSIIFAVIQIVALVSYIAAYFPGGTQTLRFGGSMALRGAGSLLPF